jgi:hypothetical protein
MKNLNKSAFLNKELQNDNVFINVEVKNLQEITGLPTISSKSKVVISEGRIVNVVSNSYAHLSNEDFFLKIEEKLVEADIKYKTRAINIDNRQFAVDYILEDDSLHIDIKGKNDNIKPMIRFTNSYDSSCKTSGSFGFYREVCSNGLHIAETKVGFSLKHKGQISQVMIPKIDELVSQFMKNEYYEIKRKFEVLAERPIYDLEDFVRLTAEELNLFAFETSEKNPEPSKKARQVMETILNESTKLEIAPNMWLGYNAFNEYIHGQNLRNFDVKKKLDTQIFDFIVENN